MAQLNLPQQLQKEMTITAEDITGLIQNGSLIAKGCRFKGELTVQGGVKIDGEVEGSIIVEGTNSLLYVSESGRVIGEIRAANVIIDGEVKGRVRADHRATVYGKLEGDLYYGDKLVVEESADINGRVSRLANLKAAPQESSEGGAVPFRIHSVNESSPSFTKKHDEQNFDNAPIKPD
ncbi:MAG: polymer-forming cytoskeletal protein [Sulfuricella sp.]|nr:polymer-forming cytoskeletal protein [Sulfuricella sp.]